MALCAARWLADSSSRPSPKALPRMSGLRGRLCTQSFPRFDGPAPHDGSTPYDGPAHGPIAERGTLRPPLGFACLLAGPSGRRRPSIRAVEPKLAGYNAARTKLLFTCGGTSPRSRRFATALTFTWTFFRIHTTRQLRGLGRSTWRFSPKTRPFKISSGEEPTDVGYFLCRIHPARLPEAARNAPT